jgi:Mg2+/citrate symporter
MAGGFDWARVFRVAVISAILFGGYLALEPYELGWAVIPAALAFVVVVLLAALWKDRLARKRLAELKRELEERQEDEPEQPSDEQSRPGSRAR